MMGGFGIMMLFGGLLFILFWVAVIGGGIWLIVTLTRGTHTTVGSSVSGQTSLDILKTRYAKGEITKEQFEEMKRDLSA